MNNTLLKGLTILELLSRSDQPLSLTQISGRLGYVKSAVHRLLGGLVGAGFVRRDDGTGAYTPSIKVWELGSATLSKLDLRLYAEDEMERLVTQTGEAVHLSVLDGAEVVYVHRVDSPNPTRGFSQVGSRAPAVCVATGKVLLAFGRRRLLDELSLRLVAHTPRSIVDPDAFLADMGRIRQQGYAINRGEWREGVVGIAAPVVDPRGAVVAGVGISGPASRFPAARTGEQVDAVLAAAAEISAALDTSCAAGGGLARIRLG